MTCSLVVTFDIWGDSGKCVDCWFVEVFGLKSLGKSNKRSVIAKVSCFVVNGPDQFGNSGLRC